MIADVHEAQSRVPGLLTELGAEVEVMSLPAGDYAVGAETLVERKRVLDLLAVLGIAPERARALGETLRRHASR